MKKTIGIILIIIAVLVIIVGGYLIYQNSNQEDQLIGGETDEHGCLGPAGYSWCKIKQKCLRIWEEYCGPEENEPAFAVLTEIRDQIGIGFDYTSEIQFEWMVKGQDEPAIDKVLISGLKIKVFDTQHTDLIEEYFKENNFEMDLYNVADGVTGSLVGYAKDDLVCHIIRTLSESNQDNPNYVESEKTEGPFVPQNPKINDYIVRCGRYDTSQWQVYKNKKYKYSLEYPVGCFFGPLSGECKQMPPEERTQECSCFLNAQDEDAILFQTFTGQIEDFSAASLSISHRTTDPYNPPKDTDLLIWVTEKFPHEEIPNKLNYEIDGIQALKVYTPKSPQAFSQTDIYFLKDDKLFNISMLDVDNSNNQEIYDKILESFKFE